MVEFFKVLPVPVEVRSVHQAGTQVDEVARRDGKKMWWLRN